MKVSLKGCVWLYIRLVSNDISGIDNDADCVPHSSFAVLISLSNLSC